MSGAPSTSGRASIVVPAYNAEDHLAEAVDSALAQTHEPTEVVVVDDGSTDGTAEVARQYGDAVRYVRQENRGVAAARNRGLADAAGDYVCFLDADDWLHPEHLRLNVQRLVERPDAVLSHGWTEVTDADLRPTGRVLRGACGRILPDLVRLIPPAVPGIHSAIIRTAAVRRVGGFDPELSTSADYDLWIRLARLGPVECVERPTVRYRIAEGSMFTDLDLQVRDMEAIVEKHRRDPELGELNWDRMRWALYRSLAGESRDRGDPAALLRYGTRAIRHGFMAVVRSL